MATVPSPADAAPAFVFVGGRPSLDLVATFGRRHAGGLERIPDPGALARWFVAAGLLAVAPPVTGSELSRARLLREAIAVLVRATIAGLFFAKTMADRVYAIIIFRGAVLVGDQSFALP